MESNRRVKMRNIFIKKLMELVGGNPDILLLTGDLGFSVFEDFIEEFPNNYFNMGIAEQNMAGVAAGLALSGKIVFIYSIAPFATSRCFEQIKLDICYHNLPVIIIGLGAGFSYSMAGSSHHCFEDISLMRVLPNMNVFCPGDPVELEESLERALSMKAPCYIRLGKTGEPIIHKSLPINIDGPVLVKKGSRGVVFTTGNMLEQGVSLVEKLTKNGLEFSLYSIPLLKPFNKQSFFRVMREYDFVCTLEEHVEEGGFSSLLSENLIDLPKKISLKRFFIKRGFIKEVGSQCFLRNKSGLSNDDIVDEIVSSWILRKNEN